MMDRRAFIVGGAVSLATPLAAEGQQAAKVYRIGFLSPFSPPAISASVESFRQGLRDLGYVEDQNLMIEYRWAHGHHERLPELAADLVRLKVNLIVAPAMESIVAAKQATATVPIVMVVAIDPVGQRLIESIARPGGNVTGLAWDPSADISEKYLDLLQSLGVKLSRVANLLDAGHPGLAPYSKAVEQAAQRLGVTYLRVEVRGPDDFDHAFSTMAQQRVQGVVVFGAPMMFRHARQVIDLAAKYRLPATYSFREAVVLGGLISYGASLTDLYRRSASYVDKILKGANPRDLPVEQPTKFELVINLKTAKALGLTIPPPLLLRADQVIE